jgi:predicted Zn finger-like uncharacterized protein
MQTSCPECRTAFRVSQAQLGLRRGLVRCGKCNAVFNAYDTLLPELEEPPVAVPEPVQDALALAASRQEDRADPADRSVAHAGGPFLLELPEEAPEQAPGEAPAGGPANMPAHVPPRAPPSLLAELPEPAPAGAGLGSPGRGAASAETGGRESPDTILLSELPNRRPSRAGLPLWRRVGYGLILLPLLALLPLQLAYFFRADLVAAAPETRPALEALCQALGCSVPLPRQLGREAIAASNLEHDAEQKSRVRLTVLLANRTGQAQTWPAISLTLTDVREDPVAQKLFPPQAYLPQDTPWARGMADGSEREIRLDLDIGNLAATGYALSLVYP